MRWSTTTKSLAAPCILTNGNSIRQGPPPSRPQPELDVVEPAGRLDHHPDPSRRVLALAVELTVRVQVAKCSQQPGTGVEAQLEVAVFFGVHHDAARGVGLEPRDDPQHARAVAERVYHSAVDAPQARAD